MIIAKRKYRLPLMLLLIGILFTAASALISLETTESWLSRSGAVLSFVSVAVQFILSGLKRTEIEELFEANHLNFRQKLIAAGEKDKIGNFVSTASVVTGLIGTAIWGYGDLLL